MPDNNKPKVTAGAGAIIKAFFGVLAAIATFYGFHAYVKHMITEQLESPEFLSEVASHIQPAIIFDEKFSILADQGGRQYVDDINISLSSSGHPTQMVVHAISHLAHQPLIESLSANEYMITAERGKKHDWVFRLVPFGTVGDEKHLFRIEIVK